MKCPKCQTDNQKDSKFCINCGESLSAIIPLDSGIRRSTVATKKYAEGKDASLAMILSGIFPGIALGQFYNGDILKGLLMLAGTLFLGWTGLVLLGIWIWSIVDARQVAKGNKSLWK